ncbi:MAG: type II secretion system protein J [Vicinamibacterales bacterium]
MVTRRSTVPERTRAAEGYTLVELIVSMGLMGLIMAATLGGLSDATKANDAVLNVTGMNASIRAGMDLMVRDMMQVGSGLPPSHVVQIPSGLNATQVRLPGPPGTNFLVAATEVDLAALVPMPGAGPAVNGVASDVVVTLTADNAFVDLPLTAITPTTVTVAAGPNLATGPDRVMPGQLMMVSKGTVTTLLQVTAVNTATRVLTFGAGDSLNLNQTTAAAGTLAALHAADPANQASAARISRLRMVTYYLDSTTDPAHPRLVRRVNNGDPTTFNNALGTAVAIDIENLQFSYDLVGDTNPANVRMTAADRDGTGRCSPNPCSETQIRKINIAMTGRSRDAVNQRNRAFRNTLASQVSFRGMAFVDEYRAPS